MKYEINYKIFDEYQKKHSTRTPVSFLKEVIKNKSCLQNWLFYAFVWASIIDVDEDFWSDLHDQLTYQEQYNPELHFEKDYKTFIDYLQNTKYVKKLEPCYEI